MHLHSSPILISSHHRVFVLTGAGISAESGLKTFRDSGGLWESHRVEEVASPEGWQNNPELVWRFYSQRRAQARLCQPNAAHIAIAALETAIGDRLFLVTQNVDDLHERAGSRSVMHMHGQLNMSRCEDPDCDSLPFVDEQLYESKTSFASCACGAVLRPHIVWFGEQPFCMPEIEQAIQQCDYFIVIGSSGSVYPAAGLVSVIAHRRNRGSSVRSVYVGPEAPNNARLFDEIRLGTACEVIPSLFGE